MELLVEFAQQEHLDACSGLLLIAIESGREHLGVVEDEDIVFIEIFQDVLEDTMFNLARLAV